MNHFASHLFLVIGLGSIGQRHARNLKQLGAPRVLALRTHLGMRAAPDNLDVESFDRLDNALAQSPDIAVVCNPTRWHVETARALVEADLHVLIEKPLSNSMSGVKELIHAAEERARILAVAQTLRFYPYVQTARAWLREGRLGAVRYIRAAVGQHPPAWFPAQDYRASYAVRRELGGGATLTFIHEIDLVLYLMGMPQTITARAAHLSSIQTDADDISEIIFGYPELFGSVHIDYVQKSPMRSRYLQIVGEDAALWLDFAKHTLELYGAEGQYEIHALENFDPNQIHLDLLGNFMDAVKGRVQVEADGQAGARAVRVALAAFESSARGVTIELGETL